MQSRSHSAMRRDAVRCCRFDGQRNSLNWIARKECRYAQEALEASAVVGEIEAASFYRRVQAGGRADVAGRPQGRLGGGAAGSAWSQSAVSLETRAVGAERAGGHVAGGPRPRT